MSRRPRSPAASKGPDHGARDRQSTAAALGVPHRRAAPAYGRLASAPTAGAVPDAAPASAATASIACLAANFTRPYLTETEQRYWAQRSIIEHNRATLWAALRLIAAGTGASRVAACHDGVQEAERNLSFGQRLLRRALSLLGPGELQELRASTRSVAICHFILFQLEQDDQTAITARSRRRSAYPGAPLSLTLSSLRTIKCEEGAVPTALLERVAGSITELHCESLDGGSERVLPRCTRLESLHFRVTPPTVWLGLSQLHTLSGVSLQKVPAASIAAALPRLHTLHLRHVQGVDFAVAPFFDLLLPRLRSLHIDGWWPDSDAGAGGSEVEDSAATARLPLLEDLSWRGYSSEAGGSAGLPGRLAGSRPSTLRIFNVALAGWLGAAPAASRARAPLGRVRALTLEGGDPTEAADVARALHAAPQLRHVTFYSYLHEHYAQWLLSDELAAEPAFAGLVHPKLRHVNLCSAYSAWPRHPVPDDCGVRLRQLHFPHLRRLMMGSVEYPVWIPEGDAATPNC